MAGFQILEQKEAPDEIKNPIESFLLLILRERLHHAAHLTTFYTAIYQATSQK
ncbi:hypothetical protein X559_1126 [Paenilisteria newyorkensis]|nr:hypothetical protein X559_1126 [Listeria newyorkensis]